MGFSLWVYFKLKLSNEKMIEKYKNWYTYNNINWSPFLSIYYKTNTVFSPYYTYINTVLHFSKHWSMRFYGLIGASGRGVTLFVFLPIRFLPCSQSIHFTFFSTFSMLHTHFLAFQTPSTIETIYCCFQLQCPSHHFFLSSFVTMHFLLLLIQEPQR